jgi:hypothetical protein
LHIFPVLRSKRGETAFYRTLRVRFETGEGEKAKVNFRETDIQVWSGFFAIVAKY